jgi:D-alanyl-D-alanine carboxypeptidase
MPRTPFWKDDQAEELPNIPTLVPPTDYPVRRRRSSPQSKRSSARYYSDEHPEIPKVKRASLRLNESQLDSSSEEEPPLHTATAKRKRIQLDEEEEPTLPPGSSSSSAKGQETGKIVVARRRRTTIYEPPPPAHYSTRGRHKQTPSLLTMLQDASHNRTFILLGSLVLLVFVLAPIIAAIATHASQLQNNSGILTSGRIGAGNAENSTPVIQPANPDEVVIMPEDTDHPAPPVFATSAYLLDADTGQTLYAYNPFQHLPMLSTTKLMTALLAIEKGNLNQRVTINDAINHDISQLAADSSVMGIKKGETYTLRDLLYGLFLDSGNDAAVAIADDIGGNLPNFVAMMNARAQQLGLYNTHYMNPHGLLQTGHYSSAHDLAILGRYVFSNATLHTISATKTYDIPQTADHPEHTMINGDQFLWWYPGVDGGKPGWDGATDFVQVVSVTRNGRHLIGVTMNTKDWWTDMRDLMNWGFDDFTWVSPYDLDISHPPIPYDYEWNYFADDKKTNTISTADHGRYYIYTGYEISGLIMAYFDKNGGLSHFGYPTGLVQVTSGTTLQQQFQHGTIQCDTASKQCKTT